MVVEKGASSVCKWVFPIYKYIITHKISSSYFLWFTCFKTKNRRAIMALGRSPEYH